MLTQRVTRARRAARGSGGSWNDIAEASIGGGLDPPAPVQSASVTTKRTTLRASAQPISRHRGHSLAPEHVGEGGSVAILALAVGGVAIFITALSLLVGGFTMGARYASNPPPNVAQLGIGLIIGGIGLLVLAAAMIGAAIAVFADVRGSRVAAAIIAGLVALLAAGGAVTAMGGVVTEPVLATILALATLTFGVSAILLSRRPA